MRFRKTLTFLILAMALIFALPSWAQQKPVAPGLSPAPTGHLPGTRIVAASLPRHGGVKPPFQTGHDKKRHDWQLQETGGKNGHRIQLHRSETFLPRV
jgi:hypothetical protein